ncbi:unnamed protein product [Schistosoma curassoni]|uniref:USP domain-containing protein n=1 Tax=Schistosoma curassoni TaxID=6186 RepID=A0A183JUS9_9TREM|nr:unnamed protein product [Schistosoma curassoni]
MNNYNKFSRHQKLDIRVDFPSSFNLRPFMTQSKGLPILYKLYAIVNHEGYSCRSGHYVSFTLRHGQWLSLNDSFVSSCIYPSTLVHHRNRCQWERLVNMTCINCNFISTQDSL